MQPFIGQQPNPFPQNPTFPPMGLPVANSAPRLSNAGSIDASGGNSGVDLQQVLRLLRTDPDFRRELKDVIMEFMEPEVQRLRDEMQQMASEASSGGGGAGGGGSRPPLTATKDGIIAKEFPGAEASVWTHQDAQGQVYGFPETIEVDLIKHNNMSYLCNVRDTVDIADVVFLIRIGRLYKSINPQSTLACVIIAREISPKAKGIADRCKMKTILVP